MKTQFSKSFFPPEFCPRFQFEVTSRLPTQVKLTNNRVTLPCCVQFAPRLVEFELVCCNTIAVNWLNVIRIISISPRVIISDQLDSPSTRCIRSNLLSSKRIDEHLVCKVDLKTLEFHYVVSVSSVSAVKRNGAVVEAIMIA